MDHFQYTCIKQEDSQIPAVYAVSMVTEIITSWTAKYSLQYSLVVPR